MLILNFETIDFIEMLVHYLINQGVILELKQIYHHLVIFGQKPLIDMRF